MLNAQWLADMIGNTTANVIAPFIIAAITWLMKKIAAKWSTRAQPNRVNGEAAKPTTRALPIAFNILWSASVFWLFAVQLHPLLTASGPPSRADSALIALWVCWANLVFVIMMFDLKLWSVDRLLQRT